MVELLNSLLVWWVWILAGLGMIIMELMTGTLILLGLGVAAVAVGILVVVAHLGVELQLLLWITLSVVFIWIFFKWFKRQKDITASGQSNLNLSTIGTVVEAIEPHARGRVVFDTPVLGSTKWTATASQSILEGSRVKILEINGQLIHVALNN